MPPKLSRVTRSVIYWSMYFLLLLLSGILALGSAYMAYKLTKESSISVGFAGIGFYVVHYLGRSLLLIRPK